MKNFYLFLILATFQLSLYSDVESLFEGKTSIDNINEFRDPFQGPRFKPVEDDQKKQGPLDSNKSGAKLIDGVFSNIPKLGPVKIEDLLITGVVIGPERRAFVKVGNSPTVYTIKEGMKLGQNNAEVKAILPGGMILVERIKNIYDEDEYLETVVPLSN